jgi:hypothetical protein
MEFNDRIEAITKLIDKQNDLIEELKISLAIMQAWPEAFQENSSVKPKVVGNLHKPKEMKVILSNATNQKTKYLLHAPPALFWLLATPLLEEAEASCDPILISKWRQFVDTYEEHYADQYDTLW